VAAVGAADLASGAGAAVTDPSRSRGGFQDRFFFLNSGLLVEPRVSRRAAPRSTGSLDPAVHERVAILRDGQNQPMPRSIVEGLPRAGTASSVRLKKKKTTLASCPGSLIR
jgi:hypothetical protein